MAENNAPDLSLRRLIALIDSPYETGALDFKETLDIAQPRDRVELAKDVLAMANSGGGDIVVGVEDGTFRRVGISEQVSTGLRDAKSVNDKLKKYCGGYVKVLVAQHEVTNQAKPKVRVVLIHVPAASSQVPAQDDGVYPDPGNPSKQKWVFRRGDVYVRKADESVKVETPNDLRAVPASAEIDAHTASEITRTYIERLVESFAHDLSPLLPNDTPKALSGQSLMQALMERRDFLVVGPSGCGKSHHLRHFCIEAAKHNQFPIMVRAGRYKGQDLPRIIDQEIAPFSTRGSKTLCTAASICGLSVVLILDGLNECEPFLEELATELQAFRLRQTSRLMASCQTDLPSKAAAKCDRIFIAPLTPSHKRFIYCFHAGIPVTPEVDHLCQGFSNGYDLAVAGRCHDSSSTSFTRVHLYDRYCRDSLLQGESVLTALLRDIASSMGRELTNFWLRDEFERYAEQFLAVQGASLSLLDFLKSSRLVSLTYYSFSFEHDLLLDYFRAEQIRREFGDVNALGLELAKPRSQTLIPFILPRYTGHAQLSTLFAAASKAEILREVLLGRCGEAARRGLLTDCASLFQAAARDLSEVKLDFTHDQPDASNLHLWSIAVRGRHQWTPYEVALSRAIAISLADPELQRGFLELLDLTQWTLRAKTREIAEQSGITFSKLWAVIVGQLHSFGPNQLLLPFFRMTAGLRESSMGAFRQATFPLVDALWARVAVNSTDCFSLAILVAGLQYSMPTDRHLDLYMAIVRAAWETRIYHLRLGALDLLHSIRWFLEEKHVGHFEEIRDLLGEFNTTNFFLSTALTEAQVAYGALEPLVSVEQAEMEMKAAASRSLEEIQLEPDIDPRERAYSLIGNIFEDIYQGVYGEAYESLELNEKVKLLCLAAQAKRPEFFAEWIVGELLRYKSPLALSVFQLYASRIDPESSSPQHSAGAYALSMAGCAHFMDEPPKYIGPDSPDHIAWQIAGRILFWVFRSTKDPSIERERMTDLWATLMNAAPLAGADALYRLHNGVELLFSDWAKDFDLVAQCPREARPLLESSLQNRSALSSVFNWGGSKDEALMKFVIESLGRIGNENTVRLLQDVADDPKSGADAIAAIRKIRESTARR